MNLFFAAVIFAAAKILMGYTMLIINDSKKILEYIAANDSMIYHKMAACIDEENNVPVIKGVGGRRINPEYLNVITDLPPLSDHIDIMLEKPFMLTYDLGDEPIDVDRFILMGFGSGLYDIRDFDLYAFNDDDAYKEENLIYSYHCPIETIIGQRNTCDAMIVFDKPVKAKKFGIKISKPNVSDDCMRISFVGVYSSKYNNTRGFLKKFGESFIEPKDILLEGSEVLCNGIAYDGSCVTVENSDITINVGGKIRKGLLRLFYTGENATVYSGNTAIAGREIFQKKYVAELPVSENDTVKLNISGKADVYEIGLYNALTEITVTDETIRDNFNGIGGCVCPMSFMDNSLKQGFNKAYWEKEKSRVQLCKPAVVRLWFQPDWFIIDEDSYYRREYDFNSEKMQAVYPYLDLYKECGTEVLLNFGWKIDDRITSWYSIPGVPRARESAPKDLDEFAYSCAEFLTELIERRGYTNIKYLTFYNEPVGRYVYSEYYTGDFHVGPPIYEKLEPGEVAPEQFAYWHKMLVKANSAIVERKLNEKIKIWGPEMASDYPKEFAGWLKGFTDDNPCLIDTFTIHKYNSSDRAIEDITSFIRGVSDISVCVTEFAANDGCGWEINNAQMAITYINKGYSGALLWLLSGTALASPLNFNIDNAAENMWRYLPAQAEGANSAFYELCMFMRYIPAHSKTLRVQTPTVGETKVFDAQTLSFKTENETNIRAAALYTPSNELTVIIESKHGTDKKNIKVNLPTKKTVRLNKFTVGNNNDLLAPASLPKCCGEISAVNGILEDTLPAEYSITFYTEQKPYPQIVCDSDVYCMRAGESRKIGYSVIDSQSTDVSFEITEGKDIAELQGDSIVLKPNAKVGSMAAVKVTLNNAGCDSYFTLLIKSVN